MWFSRNSLNDMSWWIQVIPWLIDDYANQFSTIFTKCVRWLGDFHMFENFLSYHKQRRQRPSDNKIINFHPHTLEIEKRVNQSNVNKTNWKEKNIQMWDWHDIE